MMEQKLLLTAFEPFGGEARNTALDAAALVPEKLGELRIVKQTVPTEFGKSFETVAAAIETTRPDAVLMLGQAAGRRALTPERFAVNRMHARIPDNAGFLPQNLPILRDGAERLRSTLPVEAIAEAVRAAGVPAEVSEDAGTFVCNHLFYCVLDFLTKNGRPIPAGFLHVPRSREQAAGEPLTLSQIADGLTAAIRVIGD